VRGSGAGSTATRNSCEDPLLRVDEAARMPAIAGAAAGFLIGIGSGSGLGRWRRVATISKLALDDARDGSECDPRRAAHSPTESERCRHRVNVTWGCPCNRCGDGVETVLFSLSSWGSQRKKVESTQPGCL